MDVRWLADLDAARAATLERAASIDQTALASLADLEAFAALNLEPMPTDPVAHVDVGYQKTRRYLEHLTRHDPSRIVSISARDGFVYPMTPRKILRRVMDHALDHHNQVDQWIDWQAREALPEEPRARYAEAHRRLRNQVAQLVSAPPSESFAFYGNAGQPLSLTDVLESVFAAEREIQTTGRLLPLSSELD